MLRGAREKRIQGLEAPMEGARVSKLSPKSGKHGPRGQFGVFIGGGVGHLALEGVLRSVDEYLPGQWQLLFCVVPKVFHDI